MNRKLLLGAAAGVAAIGLAIGGTTYAAFSDFGDVTGNQAGAGTLELNLADNTGGDMLFDHVKMAPGGIGTERQVYVASNDGASTPSAVLYVSLKNVVGTEDGCDGNQEVIDDGGACNSPGTGPNDGQFITAAQVQWGSYTVNSPDECTQSYAPAGHTVTGQHGGSLLDLQSQTATTPYLLNGPTLPYLAPGQGICFSMTISLGYSTNNAPQGDSASFDLHFDLNQAPYGTPTTPFVAGP